MHHALWQLSSWWLTCPINLNGDFLRYRLGPHVSSNPVRGGYKPHASLINRQKISSYKPLRQSHIPVSPIKLLIYL